MSWSLRGVTAADAPVLAHMLQSVATGHNTGVRWPITEAAVRRHICTLRWPSAGRWLLFDGDTPAVFWETYHLPAEPGVLLATNMLVHPDYRGLGVLQRAVREVFPTFLVQPGVKALKTFTTPDLFDFYRSLGFRLWPADGCPLLSHFPLFLSDPVIAHALAGFRLLEDFDRTAPDSCDLDGMPCLYYSWRRPDGRFLHIWVDPHCHRPAAVALPEGSARLWARPAGTGRIRAGTEHTGVFRPVALPEPDMPRNPWAAAEVAAGFAGPGGTIRFGRRLLPAAAWQVADVAVRDGTVAVRYANTGACPLILDSGAAGGRVQVEPGAAADLTFPAVPGRHTVTVWPAPHPEPALAVRHEVVVARWGEGLTAVLWPGGALMAGPEHHVRVTARGGAVECRDPRDGRLLLRQHADEFGSPFHASVNGYHVTEFGAADWDIAAGPAGEPALLLRARSPVRDLTVAKVVRCGPGGAVTLEWRAEGGEIPSGMHAVFTLGCGDGDAMYLPLADGVTPIAVRFPEFPHPRDFTAGSGRLQEPWLAWQSGGKSWAVRWEAAADWYLDSHPADGRPQIALELPLGAGASGPVTVTPIRHWQDITAAGPAGWPGLSRARLSPPARYTGGAAARFRVTVEDRRETPQVYRLRAAAPVPVRVGAETVAAVWQAPGEAELWAEAPARPGLYPLAVDIQGPGPTQHLVGAVIRLGDGPVRVTPDERNGHPIWTVDNGRLQFSVAPAFAGALVDLRLAGGRDNWLLTSFPRPRRLLGMERWYGGLSAYIYTNTGMRPALAGGQGRPHRMTGPGGVPWVGVRVEAPLGEGAATLVCDYLTAADSPLAAIRYELHPPPGSGAVPPALSLFLFVHLPPLGWDQEGAIAGDDGLPVRFAVPPGPEVYRRYGPAAWAGVRPPEGPCLVLSSPGGAAYLALGPEGPRLRTQLAVAPGAPAVAYLGVTRDWAEARLAGLAAVPFGGEEVEVP